GDRRDDLVVHHRGHQAVGHGAQVGAGLGHRGGHGIGVGAEQGGGGQHGGGNRDALGHGLGGVAVGVQVGEDLCAAFVHVAGHLGDALGVVADGAEGVHGHDHAHGGEQAAAGQSDQEQGEPHRSAGEQEQCAQCGGDDAGGVHGRFEADPDAGGHHGGRRDQSRIGVVRGELLAQSLDGTEGGGQVDEGGHGRQGGADESGDVEAAVDGRKAGLAAAHTGDEHAQHGHQGSDGGDDQREDQSGFAHGEIGRAHV